MKDPALRSISPLARGVWMDILCVMFESEKRGYLQINGKAPSEEQIARMVGCSGDEISRAMSELREASVFSTTANGVIYSRRIVRDEEIRNKRSKSGTLGGNPSFQKGKPNPYYEKDKQNDNQEDKQKITPSSSSSSSSSKELKDKETKPPEKPPADHPPEAPKNQVNGTEPHKKPYGPPKTDIQKVVSGFKAVMNVPDDDREWDAVYFRRYSRPAADLLRLCGGDVLVVADCIDQVSAAMEKKGLSWTPETIVKHAGDWKNGRLFK